MTRYIPLLMLLALSGCVTSSRDANALKGAAGGAIIGGAIGLAAAGPPGGALGAATGAAAGAGLGASQPTDDYYRSVMIVNIIRPPHLEVERLAYVHADDADLRTELEAALRRRGWATTRNWPKPQTAVTFMVERQNAAATVRVSLPGVPFKGTGPTADQALAAFMKKSVGD